jgi:hypothetical protein
VKARSTRARIVVAALIVIGGYLAVVAILFPWSLSLVGGPVLVGEWYGEVTTPTGERLRVALDLSGRTGRCSYPCNRLDVIATVCGHGGSYPYTGYGDVENWRGTKLHASITPERPVAAQARTLHLQGVWISDVIRATVRFGPRPRSQVTVSEDAVANAALDADRLFATPVTLRRGKPREFEASCLRLR